MELIEWYVFWFFLIVAMREIIKIFGDVALEIMKYGFHQISKKMLVITIFNLIFDIIIVIGTFHLAIYY
jgi:hypothetical protein